MSRRAVRFAAVLALPFLATRPLAAQVEVTPFIGAAIPTRSLVVDTAAGLVFRMRPHTLYGLRAGTALSERLTVEAALAVGSGSLEGIGADVFEFGSTMFLADLRGRLRIAGGREAGLVLVGGIGYTDQDVSFLAVAEEVGYGSFQGKVTGIAGVGVEGRLGGRLRVSLDLLDRIHAQGIEAPGLVEGVKKTQHDVVVTAGVSVPLGG